MLPILESLEARNLMAANVFINPASGDLSITFDNHIRNTADVYASAPGLITIHAEDGNESTTVTFPALRIQQIHYTGNAVFADLFNWTDVPETVDISGEQLQVVKYGGGSATINAHSTGYAMIVDYGPGFVDATVDSPFTISLLNYGSTISVTGYHQAMWK